MHIIALSFALLTTLTSQAALLSPSEALKVAMEKPLKLVGKYVPPSSESGRYKTCVFRNADVTVLYDYCQFDEVPALSVHIIPHAANHRLTFYAEGTDYPSRIRRSDYYNVYWRVATTLNLPSYRNDMTAPELAKYELLSRPQSGCGVFFMEGFGNIERCFEGSGVNAQDEAAWLSTAVPFWKEPSEDWYEFQKHMRTIIEKL